MSFWENVDEELEYKGLTRSYLAKKAGFSLTNIGRGIQLGSSPSAETAVRIAQVLGVSVEYLVTGKDSKNETLSFDIKKFHKYRALIDKIDLLPEKQKLLIQTLVSQMSEWQ